MKKLTMSKTLLFRWMITLFVFCMCGGLMQMIAPEFPEHAIFIGILFFGMAAVLGVVIWKLRIAVREERIAASEQAVRERKRQAD